MTATLTPAVTTVRFATAEDVPDMVAMGTRFLRTIYAGLIVGDEATMTALAHGLLANPDGVWLLAERQGVLVGMLGGLAYRHPMSGEPTAAELCWWVQPEARGCGLRLLKRFEQWAREKGAVVLQMIAPTAETETLYQRLGFDRVEVTYQRRLS